MNITLHRTTLLVCVLAGALALAIALVAAKDVSAQAANKVVGPGESIQKAVYAADPGDTIVVRGVHREDVVIRKNGIKLRGDDAVIEAPTTAKADSPCSKVFGPEAICVLGDVNLKTGELTGPRVSDVSVSGFTIRGFKNGAKGASVIDVSGARNTTVVGNRLILGNRLRGQVAGPIVLFRSVNTTLANNDVIGSPETDPETDAAGINVFSSSRTTFVGNNISGIAWGIAVTDAHQGTFTGNTIHNTCGGMFFEAAPSQPVDDFEVKGNTVENNTRSCRAAKFGANFSGIGIAVLGASGIEVTANHLSGNVPSGPTPVSGGVIVSINPFFGGSVKPRNNSIIGNHLGYNKPDIFYDKSGSGNRFLGNHCNTSVPSSLCD